MINKTKLSAIILGIALGGCSSSNLKAPPNFPQLTIKADEANTLLFTKPNLALNKYNKIYIAPVTVQISDAQGKHSVTDAEAKRLANHAESRLKEEIGKQKILVDEPDQDVLSIRFIIIDLEPTSKAQLVMMVPPFATINMLLPKGAFLGSITLAGQLHEGLAMEPSVAFVATRSRPGIDATVAFSPWAVAEKIIDKAAERLAADLTRVSE